MFTLDIVVELYKYNQGEEPVLFTSHMVTSDLTKVRLWPRAVHLQQERGPQRQPGSVPQDVKDHVAGAVPAIPALT